MPLGVRERNILPFTDFYKAKCLRCLLKTLNLTHYAKFTAVVTFGRYLGWIF